MTITQLEYILAVEKYQHFSKAAESCSISQPTLSMQIQKLEEDLGVIIFDRSKNPIITTSVGAIILKQAKKVIHEFKNIEILIEKDKDLLSGDFNVGVIPTLAPYIIPLFIGEFSIKYPKVNLLINEMKTEDIITALDNDKIDAGILATPLHQNQIIERKLFDEPFHIYSSINHPFNKRKEIDSKTLTLENLWLLNEGHCFREQTLNLCKLKAKANSNVSFESGNLETLKNIIDRNNGYTLLPHLATLNLSTLTNVSDFKSPVPSREISIVHSRIYLKEKLIDALEEIIISNLPKSIVSNKRKIQTIEIYNR